MLRSTFLASTSALGCAAALSLFALSASSPAAAQFACTPPTSNPLTCINSGTEPNPFLNTATGVNQGATTSNSGSAVGFESLTTGGGNAIATNTGSDTGDAAMGRRSHAWQQFAARWFRGRW